MREIYIVYFWPDFEDSPQNLVAVKSEIEAQKLILSFWENAAYDNYLSTLAWDPVADPRDFWDDESYALDFGYNKVNFLGEELP